MSGAKVYEVWSYYMGSGPTVEETYDNYDAARDHAESLADDSSGTWKTEVARLTGDDAYEIEWQSEDDDA